MSQSPAWALIKRTSKIRGHGGPRCLNHLHGLSLNGLTPPSIETLLVSQSPAWALIKRTSGSINLPETLKSQSPAWALIKRTNEISNPRPRFVSITCMGSH